MSLSPDGRFVAYADFQSDDEPRSDIFVLAVDGSSEGRLVRHPSNETLPLWTPDGERVMFVSNRSGRRALWAVKMSNGEAVSDPEVIRPDIGTMTPQRFGKTGRGILFHNP